MRLIDRIPAAKAADPAEDTSADEAEIAPRVYELYGLMDAEVVAVGH